MFKQNIWYISWILWFNLTLCLFFAYFKILGLCNLKMNEVLKIYQIRNYLVERQSLPQNFSY